MIYPKVPREPINQFNFESKLITLDRLKSLLYSKLIPLELIKESIDNNEQLLSGFIFWHEDQMVELPSFTDFRINLDFQIELYTQLIAKLKEIDYNLDSDFKGI